MCKFDLDCEKLNGKTEHTNIYVQTPMKRCLQCFENCDSHLVVREGNARICTDPDVAKKESQYRLEL